MFQSVLKKRKNPIFNIVGWILLTVATIALAFLGLTSGTSLFSTGGAAAEVNSKIIAISDVQEQVEMQLEQRRGGGPVTAPQRKSLELRVLDGLIKRELILQAAEENHIYVSDKEILDVIMEYPTFKEDGRFSKSRYKQVFENYKARGINIEERIRDDILVRRIQDLFKSSLSQIALEEAKEELIKNTKINVRFLEVDKNLGVDPKTISNGEAKSFLANDESLKRVEDHYEKNKSSEYTSPERVRASIILLKAPDEDMKKSSDALDKIQKIKEELKTTDFAELAAKYSEDPISKKNKGDLGFFERGSFDPKVESAAFAMKVGDVSDAIKSEQGYNLIKVTDKVPSKELPLDDALKLKIAKSLIATERSSKMLEEIKGFLTSNNLSGLESLAKARGLKWQETGFYDLASTRIPKIGVNQEFFEASFGLEKKGQLHGALLNQGSKSYVVSLIERKNEPAKDDPMKAYPYFKELFARSRVDGVIRSWTDKLTQEASISKSPTYQ